MTAPAILVSDPIAKWLLEEGARDPARAFDGIEPHACKLCGQATPPSGQRRHLADHRKQRATEARRRERERNARLRKINQLRRETR